MTEQELQSIVGSYVAGNSITRSVANNLGRIAEEQNRQIEESKARLAEYYKNCPSAEVLSTKITEFVIKQDTNGAISYLDNTLANNLTYLAKTTKESPCSLDEIVERTKSMYQPFYEKVGGTMSSTIVELSADKLCEMLGIEKFTPIPQEVWDRRMAELDKEVNGKGGCLGSFFFILLSTASILSITACCFLRF